MPIGNITRPSALGHVNDKPFELDHFRYWPLADVDDLSGEVHSWPEADMPQEASVPNSQGLVPSPSRRVRAAPAE